MGSLRHRPADCAATGPARPSVVGCRRPGSGSNGGASGGHLGGAVVTLRSTCAFICLLNASNCFPSSSPPPPELACTSTLRRGCAACLVLPACRVIAEPEETNAAQGAMFAVVLFCSQRVARAC